MPNPLLLLHGALGSKEQFVYLSEILSEYREVYIMDFEGHGKFESESNFSVGVFRENVVSFMERKSLDKVDVFGYSMGGYVAMDVAFHHPELLGKIVTLGTKFTWNPEIAAKEVRMLDPVMMQEKIPAFVQRLQELHGKENWRKVVLNTAAFIKELGDNPPLGKAEIKRISIPVLVCLGKLDTMVAEEESIKVTEYLENGAFMALDNFKHPIESAPMVELAHIINSYLNGNINKNFN